MAVSTRKQIESRGWKLILNEAKTIDYGGGESRVVPGTFEAEAIVVFASGPRAYRIAETSLDRLLGRLDDFDREKGRL